MSLAIVGLTAEPGDGQVAVTWDAPISPVNPVVDYQVAYSLDGIVYALPESTGTLGFIFTGLTNGTNYWFRVRANDTIESGDWSEPVQATPDVPAVPVQQPVGQPPPPPPSPLQSASSTLEDAITSVANTLNSDLTENQAEVARLTASIGLHLRMGTNAAEFVAALANSNSVAFNRAGMRLFAAANDANLDSTIQQASLGLLLQGMRDGSGMINL